MYAHIPFPNKQYASIIALIAYNSTAKKEESDFF